MFRPVTFQHEAMATTFRIVVAGRPVEYARQAAAAACRELDRLENELSRFVDSSDIARANRAAEGEEIPVGDDALQCLLIAARLSEITRGTFDPAYASQREAGGEPRRPLFAIDAERHTLTSLCPRLQLDLGAVGKGYALDQLAEVLRDWDVANALLESGGSSVLALDAPAQDSWRISVGPETLALTQFAASGSGLTVQGEHLVDPRNGSAAARRERTWAFAPTAAESDALSTAYFVMTDGEVAEFCGKHPEYGAAILGADGRIAKFGRVPPRAPTVSPQ